MMLIASLLLSLVTSPLLAKEKLVAPKMENNKIVLGKQIDQLLKSKHPDYRVLSPLSFTEQVNKITKNRPSSIIGDFNGDKIPDAAIFGYSKKSRKLFIYAAISSKNKGRYKLREVNEFPFMKNQTTTNYTTYLQVGKSAKNQKLRDLIQVQTQSKDINQSLPYYYSIKQDKVLPFRGTME